MVILVNRGNFAKQAVSIRFLRIEITKRNLRYQIFTESVVHRFQKTSAQQTEEAVLCGSDRA